MDKKDQKLSQLEAWLSLEKRENEKVNKAGERKVQELKIELAHSKEECEALQNKSKKLEKDKEDLAEKEQNTQSEHQKRVQEMNKEHEKRREADQKKVEDLQMYLARSTHKCEALPRTR